MARLVKVLKVSISTLDGLVLDSLEIECFDDGSFNKEDLLDTAQWCVNQAISKED